ncbi:Vgb family protein [Bradyrhizobium sp. AZCC 2289]|uniref:Vgb family protein n=1 Tax=Bradyrhizobium sp. AZCC 2289 TaxID=3117026 RepID=UPI002FF0DF01
MKRSAVFRFSRAPVLGAALALGVLATGSTLAAALDGEVLGGGAPVANATVTLWAASAGAPKQLAQTTTGTNGSFTLNALDAADKETSLYLVARGGRSAADKTNSDNPAIALMTVVGAKPPARVTINEFTTIASVWTHNQFIDGTAIKGSPLALRIAAGNVPNFVDLETGGYGVTIQDALNSSQTPTMANLATLGTILAGCTTQVTAEACAKLFAAATPPTGVVPTDTLTAVEAIARYPWYHADKIFALLDAFYPVPSGKKMRLTPYMPYLTFAPNAWVFPLKFAGGGNSGGGKLMIDSQGNAWVGNNFLVGAQNQSILWDGNLSKFAPNGKPLSPMTTGFTGGGLSGVGFGLAIDAQDNVWVGGYASQNIARFDNAGKPLSPPEGWTVNGQLGEMQGIIVTRTGDIWAVDEGKGQIVHLPKGDPAQAHIYCQNATSDPLKNPCGLVSPFHLAIDDQDRIWVSNNIGSAVIRFNVSDPTKVEKFEAGYGGSGMAIDSQGNVWRADRFGSSERGRLKQAEMLAAMVAKGEKEATEVLVHRLSAQKPGYWDGGSVTVLRPDGSKAPFSPVTGKGLAGPWAVAVDGNDNVWVSNLDSDSTGIVQLCGVRAENCPPGMKTGDAISPQGGYVGGGMQQLVDIDIGPAGDVWVTNNWDIDAAAFGQASEALSTRGAGQGVVVFYGMAKPVKTPLIGPPRAP